VLGFELSRPDQATDGETVAVLLHGRGSHRGDLQALRPRLPEAWTLLTPEAPHPGHPWGYGPGWAWYRYEAQDRLDEETLQKSLAALDGFLAEMPHLVGFTPGRVVLGGFSQGGTTSMAYGFTRPAEVDLVLNFSGFLADVSLLDGTLGPEVPPVFWGHGLQDPNIPHDLARKGRARLAEHQVPHRTGDYGIGHWIDPAELDDALDFIRIFDDES